MTIGKFFNLSMFEYWLNKNKTLSESTIHKYVSCIKQFILSDIDINDTNEVIKYVVNHTFHKRNYMMFYAIMLYAELNITDKKKLQEFRDILKERRPVMYTRKKETKILDDDTKNNIVCNLETEKHKIIAWIQKEKGTRCYDTMTLRRSCVTEDKVTGIKSGKSYDILKLKLTTKGKDTRVVVIYDEQLRKAIIRYMNLLRSYMKVEDSDDEYIFLEDINAKDNKKFWNIYQSNYRIYHDALKLSLKKSGIDPTTFSTHDWRRLFARDAFSKKKDIEELQKILGHKRMETTSRYLSSTGSDVEHIYGEMEGYE